MLAIKKSKSLPQKTLEVLKLGDGNKQNKSEKELTSSEFNKVCKYEWQFGVQICLLNLVRMTFVSTPEIDSIGSYIFI